MATLDIEFRTKGFAAGEKQTTGLTTSVEKLESVINGVNFDSLTKHLQSVGIALSTATNGVNGLSSALVNASKVDLGKSLSQETINQGSKSLQDAKIATEESRKAAIDFGAALRSSLSESLNNVKIRTEETRQATESFKQSLLDEKRVTEQAKSATELKKQSLIDSKIAIDQARIATESERTANERARKELTQFRLENIRNRKEISASSGSYTEAQQRLSALGRSIKNASGSFGNLTPVIKAQINEYNRLNDGLKNVDKMMGNHQRNVGNYGDALASAVPYFAQFTTAAGLAALAVEGLKKSFDTNLKFESVNQALKFTSGSTEEFSKNIQFLSSISYRLGLNLLDTSNAFKQWQGAAKFSNLTADQTRSIFESVANAGAKMKLSNEQITGTFLALSQMLSKGKVQAEELRGQLGERLPGAFALAAKAMGVTETELNKLLETGQVVSGDFLPKFAKELDRSFGNDKTEKITSMQSAVNRLSNEFDDLFKSDNASRFFTTVIDGATGIINSFKKVTDSKNAFEGLFRYIAQGFKLTIPGALGNWATGGGLDQFNDAIWGTAKGKGNITPSIPFVGMDNKFSKQVGEFSLFTNAIKNNSSEVIKNKQYWDSQVKSIKASLEALDSNQKGTRRWMELTSQLQKAQNNLDSFSLSKSTKQEANDTKSRLDLEKRIQQIRNDGLNYYDKKLSDINQKYSELTRGITGADLAQAKLNEQAEKFKVFVELANDVFKDMRKQSISPTFEISNPVNIGDRMAQSAKDYNVRFFKNANARFKKDQEDKDAERLQNRLSKVVESGMRQGIGGILGDISQLGSNFQQVFSNVFNKLAGSLNKTLQDVIATELGSKLSKLFDSDNFQIGKLSKDISKGIVAGAGIAGGLISSMTSPTSKLGQGLGGALAGAAAGTAIAPGIGTLIGGALGALSGIFGASQADKARKLQEQQVLEQKRTNMLLERQQALSFTSDITGQATNQGIVTGVERNEFGDITFEIEGRKLKTVIDRENLAQGRGLF